jgi:hypothetical protein
MVGMTKSVDDYEDEVYTSTHKAVMRQHFKASVSKYISSSAKVCDKRATAGGAAAPQRVVVASSKRQQRLRCQPRLQRGRNMSAAAAQRRELGNTRIQPQRTSVLGSLTMPLQEEREELLQQLRGPLTRFDHIAQEVSSAPRI